MSDYINLIQILGLLEVNLAPNAPIENSHGSASQESPVQSEAAILSKNKSKSPFYSHSPGLATSLSP